MTTPALRRERSRHRELLRGGRRASPLAADGKVFFLNVEGTTTVIEAAPVFRRLAEKPIDDRTFASPAFARGWIYIRGREALWCVGKRGGFGLR